jgi:uncharacterized membrane protein YjgN (DUF898 family)
MPTLMFTFGNQTRQKHVNSDEEETMRNENNIPDLTSQNYGRDAYHAALATVPAFEQPVLTQHKFEFTGSSNEYFRIWIVNVFLSVITLGIYNAWAKVRTRQYFYANTRLDGHPFEYLGNPIAILKGNLVVGLGAFLYSVIQRVNPFLSLGIALIASLVFPYLIYQSLRFMASNSSYRNIRFRFHGTLKQAYTEYLFYPLLILVTGGLIYPYIQLRQHQYLLNNAAYGTSRNTFNGKSDFYYGIYIRIVLMSIALYAVFAVIVVFIVTSSRGINIGSFGSNPYAVFFFLVPIYAVLLLMGALFQQYAYVNIHNYMFRESGIPGKVRFVSHLDTWTMVKLQIVNLLAIIFSLGLMSPWAKIRKTQYILNNMSLVSSGGLEDVMADVAESQNAIGDAVTDYFNVDFGL